MTLKSKAARALAALRKTHGGGRPPVFKPCRYCSELVTTRELKPHQRVCPKKPARKGAVDGKS